MKLTEFLKLDWRKIFIVYVIILFPEILFFFYWVANLYVFAPFIIFSVLFLAVLIPRLEKSSRVVLIVGLVYVYIAFLYRFFFLGFVSLTWDLDWRIIEALGPQLGILVDVVRTGLFIVYYLIASSLVWVYDIVKK